DPVASAKAITFEQCAEAYARAHSAGWSAAYTRDWVSRNRRHVFSVIGRLPIATIDTALVMKVLEPIWSRIPQTANLVRQQIEAVLNWATAREYRVGDNPARWCGHVDNLLPAVGRLYKTEHRAALPYHEVPALVAMLRSRKSLTARLLE